MQRAAVSFALLALSLSSAVAAVDNPQQVAAKRVHRKLVAELYVAVQGPQRAKLACERAFPRYAAQNSRALAAWLRINRRMIDDVEREMQRLSAASNPQQPRAVTDRVLARIDAGLQGLSETECKLLPGSVFAPSPTLEELEPGIHAMRLCKDCG